MAVTAVVVVLVMAVAFVLGDDGVRRTILLADRLPSALLMEKRWKERRCPWPEERKAFFTRDWRLLAVSALSLRLTCEGASE